MMEEGTQNREARGTYEKDGVLYCAVCHTPRVRVLNLGDRELRVRCLCRCQTQQRDREEALAKQREFRDRVSRNRSVGLTEPALRTYTFENDRLCCPEIAMAKKYVAHWEQMKQCASGLLLWGDVGTGKTYAAACVANALLDQGVTVMMTNFGRVLSDLPGMFSGDRNRYLDSFNQYDLLIIDDFGVERGSEYVLEQVFHIVDGRSRARKPLIVTTNLTLQELKNPDSLAKSRIYDRILERCVPVRFSGRNLRRENARENLEQARQLLK